MNGLKQIFVLGIFLLSIVSCRDHYGYGVVLWSANEIELASGMIVHIVGESQRREIFRVEHPDTKVIIEVDKWRLAQFERKAQATEYLKEYASHLRSYVDVRRSALPMREDPMVSAKSIYTLREGQALKVLARSPEREQIGGYMAYWYHILSADGVAGWTYGRFLREYILTESGQAIYDERDYTGDAILENFFDPSNVWRPLETYQMVQRGEVNLALVREEYGLFINPESKIIVISLPDQNVEFTYSRITPVGGDAYMFVDSPFSFTLRPDRVEARYSLRGRNYTAEFRTLDKDIRTVITEEETRRARMYQTFVRLGPTFRSDLGSLTFTYDGGFVLNDVAPLQQLQILSASDGNTGTVAFDLFLDRSISSSYDGVFSLIFSDSGKRLSFAYKLGGAGFEATWVEFTPANRVVLSQHISALETIFVS